VTPRFDGRGEPAHLNQRGAPRVDGYRYGPLTDPGLKRFRSGFSGFSHSVVSRLRRHREHRSEGVADPEQRSELLKNSACRIVQSRNDLLPGECREIISEFRPQEHVREQTELHASADAEDDFPYIICSEAGDLRNRLWERLRTGDDIFLRAGTSGEKWPPTMFARLEMEQQLRRQGIGLALNVGFHTGRLKERVAVVIKVTNLGGDVI